MHIKLVCILVQDPELLKSICLKLRIYTGFRDYTEMLVWNALLLKENKNKNNRTCWFYLIKIMEFGREYYCKSIKNNEVGSFGL